MKLVRKFIFCSCLLLVLFSALFSIEAIGLSKFQAEKKYDDSFIDVTNDSWFIAGVKCVYEKGIMSGMGEQRFSPDGNLTKAEAITIAARIYAKYHGQTIAESDGAWYQKYYDYAKKEKLLPQSLTDGDDLDTLANREFIAYIFSKVIDAQEIPAVNLNVIIVDFDQISSEYKEAVSAMYKGGIITGKTGGAFDPGGPATRAEIATIVMRLLESSERISSDPKIDAGLASQQSNFMNHIPYYKTKDGYAAFVGNSAGETDLYYQQGEAIDQFHLENRVNSPMYIGNYLYFLETEYGANGRISDSLVRFDRSTQSKEKLYSTSDRADAISAYFVYDDMLYLSITHLANAGSRYEFHQRIYSVNSNKAFTKLVEVEGFGDALSVFDGKIYYEAFPDVYCYDLKTKTNKRILSSVRSWVMNGNTLYYLDYENNVFKTAAHDTENPKLLATVDTDWALISINYSEGKLYVTDDEWWSNLYRCEANGTASYQGSFRSIGYNLGVWGDMVYYSEAEYFSTQMDGWMTTLQAPFVDSKRFYNWYYQNGLPSDAAVISKDTLEMAQNQMEQLSVPDTEGSPVTWTTSDAKVASVDINGVVKAHAAGVATIYGCVRQSGQEVSCIVTVTEEIAEGSEAGVFDPASGSTVKLTAKQIYANCSPAVFYIEVYDASGNVYASGSGFFIDSEGTAVTNYHVVEEAYAVRIYLMDGRAYWAKEVISASYEKDIVIFKVEAPNLPYLTVGNSDMVLGGEVIYTIGSPLGLESTISDGLVSNPKRNMGDGRIMIQISAPISEGSSGGALINEYGQVIGITTGAFTEGQNLNLAIPINEINALIK